MGSNYLYLTTMLGGPGAPRYPVSDDVQLIGRAEQADISLFEPTVSRRHATIGRKSGSVVLEDLGSKHGTFVNSRRISRAVLKVGDIVVFGLSLVLRLEETDQPVSPPEPLKIPSSKPAGLDEPLITAVREIELPVRQPREPQTTVKQQPSPSLESLQDQLARARQLAEVGRICQSLLPDAHVRLNDLRETLQQWAKSSGDGPYAAAAITSADAVIAAVAQILEATGGRPKKTAKTWLKEMVQQALSLVSDKFSSRRVVFLAEIPDEMRVLADPDLLLKSFTWLFKRAGKASPSGSPVQIIATSKEDTVVLVISYLGVEHLDSSTSVALRFRAVRDLISSIGGKVTVESRPNVGSTVRVTLRSAC